MHGKLSGSKTTIILLMHLILYFTQAMPVLMDGNFLIQMIAVQII
jgi:hypothetical protein